MGQVGVKMWSVYRSISKILLCCGTGQVFKEGFPYREYLNSLPTKKQTIKFFVCKFSRNVKSKLYQIDNSKARVQTV